MSSSVVTEQSLKLTSGEFCLESIFILDVSSKDIVSLGYIPKCVNLCMLDLSSNLLSNVEELTVLVHLEHLNLSNNNISKLGGLDKLENLYKLELAGNRISRFNALSPLTSLLNLKHLTLQIDIHHPSTPPLRLTNPVCHDPNYTIVMCESFSSLLWLDGEAFEGVPGSKFFKEVRDVKEQGSKSGGGGLRMGKPHDSNLQVSLLDPLSLATCVEVDEEMETITKLLTECRETGSKVQQHLDLLRTGLDTENSGLKL